MGRTEQFPHKSPDFENQMLTAMFYILNPIQHLNFKMTLLTFNKQ